MAVVEDSRATPRSSNGAPPLRVAPVRRQRNVPWRAVGLLLVVGGALLFALVATRLADRQPVLAMARAVPAGQVIADSDLKVVQLSVDGELRGIPAADRAEVVGKPAVSDLAPDTLLIRDDVGKGSGLSRGKAVVGLGLKAGQLPSEGLGRGARVIVLDTGEATGGGRTEPKALAEGLITAVEEAKSGVGAGTVVVSVVVDESLAPAIAAANAAGRVALVLVSS